jgi:ATP-dependent Lon protease
MATALMSLISGCPVRDDVAMTGELTLTGDVLPIGGLKEKALAAQRNGIRVVIAPRLNEQDVDDIPEHLRAEIDFRFVDHIGAVFAIALEDAPGQSKVTPARARRRASSPERRAARSA